MQTAIDFLKSRGLVVGDSGTILSNTIDDLEAMSLIDELEEITMTDDYCYTIVINKITKIEI